MDSASSFTYLDINDILPNRFQPRIHFDDLHLNELAESIRKYGVIEPIIVRQIGSKYEIIAGERRYKASKIAGRSTIPSIVITLTDKESEEIALLENVQRQNLTPIEEAVSYKRILDMGYITQEDLAKKLGKSQSTIANKIRLLNLDDEVQYALLNGKISERHARSLLRLRNESDQVKMLNKIINERLTVKKTDDAIKELLEGPKEEKPKKMYTGSIEDLYISPVIKPTDEIEELFKEPLQKKPRRAIAVASHEIIRVKPPKELEDKLKGKEEGNMDIDKIMQEAQDINVPEQGKDISNLMTINGVSAIQPPTPNNVQPENIPNTEVPVDDQNKFVNFAGMAQEEQAPAPIPTPNGVSFDSMFNAAPAGLEQSAPVQPTEAPKPVVTPQSFEPQQTPSFSVPEPNSFNQPVNPVIEPIAPIPEQPQEPSPFNPVPPVNQNATSIAEAVQRAMNSEPPAAPIQDNSQLYNELVQPEPAPMPSFEPQQTPEFSVPESNNFNQPVNPVVEPIAPIPEQPQGMPFTAPSEPALNIPNTDIIEENGPQLVQPNKFNEVLTIIRNCSNQIEKLGYYIDVDEIDMGNTYQATFKITKQ